MRLLLCIIALTVLSGCAQPQKQATRQEFMNFTTREYVGVAPGQVLDAAEKIFRLSDGDDYSFSWGENSIKADRRYNVFLVFAADTGVMTWDVKAEQTEHGVKVSALAVDHRGDIYPPYGDFTFNGPASYEMFYQRLDYMLGKSEKWLTCKAAEVEFKKNDIWGELRPWCYVVEDDEPEVASL